MLLICPKCSKPIRRTKKRDNYLICANTNCKYHNIGYPIKNNFPVIIPFSEEYCVLNKKNIFKAIDSYNKTKKERINLNFIKYIFAGISNNTIKNYKYLADNINRSHKVLIIGGGTRGSGSKAFFKKCLANNNKIDSLDIYPSSNVNLIADAHYLPFPKESYDIIIIQAVLEHVINPSKVVSEIYRILRKEGIIYAETPFLQSVHMANNDFTRFTHSGHRWLFRNFLEIKSGITDGATYSLLFVFSSIISGVFKNKLIGILLRLILGRLSRKIDAFLPWEVNIKNGCGFYFLGKKSKLNKPKKSSNWIIEFYDKTISKKIAS